MWPARSITGSFGPSAALALKCRLGMWAKLLGFGTAEPAADLAYETLEGNQPLAADFEINLVLGQLPCLCMSLAACECISHHAS